MIKVLLVEDEAGIRNTLMRTFNWAEIGCSVQGAQSGLEALDIAIKSPPDIIITDIVMPGIDGITLVRYLKQRCPGLKVIIITGHRDFEFAKNSLNLGANAFLLKPIKNGELKDNLARVVESINADREIALQKDASASDERLLTSLLSGYLFNPGMLRGPLRDAMASARSFVVAALTFDLSENETENNLHSLAGFIRSVHAEQRILAARMNDSRVALLLPIDDENEWRDGVREHFKMLQQQILDTFHYTVSVGISSLTEDLGQAGAAYAQATRAVSWKFFSGKMSVNLFQEDAEGGQRACPNMDFVNGIPELLSQGTMMYITRQTEEFFHDIRQSATADINRCKSEILCVAMMCLSKVAPGSQAQFLQKYDFFNSILTADTLEDIQEQFVSILVDLKDYNRSRSGAGKKEIVKAALDYLDRHFSESVSLNGLATELYVSPAYLSTLISSETGKTFVDILNSLRIRKAVELLMNTNLKNYSIAEQVGYKEPQYFSVVFKKYTGLSPTEYRAMYSAEGAD